MLPVASCSVRCFCPIAESKLITGACYLPSSNGLHVLAPSSIDPDHHDGSHGHLPLGWIDAWRSCIPVRDFASHDHADENAVNLEDFVAAADKEAAKEEEVRKAHEKKQKEMEEAAATSANTFGQGSPTRDRRPSSADLEALSSPLAAKKRCDETGSWE